MILQQEHPSTNSAAAEQETEFYRFFILSENSAAVAFLKGSAGYGCQVHVWKVSTDQ